MAKKQAVVGIALGGVQKIISALAESSQLASKNHLPANEAYKLIGMSKKLFRLWIGYASTVIYNYSHHQEVLEKLDTFLQEKGYRAIFMKGLVCASRYPDPQFRQCGDIDFVVKRDEFERVMRSLEEIAKVNHDLIHEHHGIVYIDNVMIEPHYKIHNFQNPWNDHTMAVFQKKLLTSTGARTISIGNAGKEIEVFPSEFEGMHLVSHMVNHVYEEGLGLRQVIDFAMWIKVMLEEGNNKLELYHVFLDKMNMTRAARIFTRICEKYLGIDTSALGYHYSSKELAFADRMMQDIMSVGNFAKESDKKHDALNSYLWTTKRSFQLYYLCPSEALWWPLSKFGRYVKKRIISIIRKLR